jgi:hypothetical protein
MHSGFLFKHPERFCSNTPKIDIVLALATMVKKIRPTTWKNGAETVPMISDAFSEACPQLFMSNETLYSSEEMQTGIDTDALSKWALPLLHPLVKLDPRGGYFSQSDIQEGLTMQANLEVNKVHLEKMAAERKMSPSGFFTHAHGSWKNCLVTWMYEVGQCLIRTDISGSGNA